MAVFHACAHALLMTVLWGHILEADAQRYVGCYKDSRPRDIPSTDKLTDSDAMTVERCFYFCRNFQYFGIQAGYQCRCGTSYGYHGKADESECDMTCPGDSKENCGGDWRNAVYETPRDLKEEYIGCYKDQYPRDIPSSGKLESSKMYVQKCLDHCRGYRYFGLQDGEECRCGNSYGYYGKASSESECDHSCAGNSSQICGGNWRNGVYEIKPKYANAVFIKATAYTEYKGCYKDQYPRDIPSDDKLEDTSGMDIQKCLYHCKGFRYFGIQKGYACRCGNSYGTYGKTSDSECDMSCPGEGSEICGGDWRNVVYEIKSRPSTTVSQNTEYKGCYKDKYPRDIPSSDKLEDSRNMDLQMCYDHCKGYQYFGIQSGFACRCGNSYGTYGKTSDSECFVECPGERSEVCGGDWRNVVYKYKVDATSTSTSAPFTGAQLSYVALGDWGKPGSSQEFVAATLGKWAQDHSSQFTLALGDNFYEIGVSGVDDPQFENTWRKIYTHSALQKTWYVIAGNHDHLFGRAKYQTMFAAKEPRWFMPRLYYSFYKNVGTKKVHFIMIDTDPLRGDGDRTQMAWFRAQLAASLGDWIIVVGHHPVFSSGDHGKRSSTQWMYDNVRPLLEQYKVALYICGHDHDLEHLHKKSASKIVDYVISGSGSKTRNQNPTALSDVKKWNVESTMFSRFNGFVGLEMTESAVKVSYIDQYGREIYSFIKNNPKV
ncbi:uncharacterized protein LOC106161105 isoform X1 [Lingula anatina]|uniref:Tartrate-resistant acid phosphatase type 5 n=1 Tax=Lingula anatina TaxID=7574 RepID=A0A1S3I6E8_LINAN|nr:uncharacterized protein LOC106161105 isoform X1 [Lingula anatina]|eukprot:XP_013393421.1 uncharacterized protein LOC106161105 isoform X1 [Lingula anatina]